MTVSACQVLDCPNNRDRLGFCSAHYHRWQRYGDPLAGAPFHHKDVLARIERLISKEPNGCWEWKGNVTRLGYGRVTIGKRGNGTRQLRSAHSVVYQYYKGAITDGMELDHLCRNRRCVNPDHLELVTHTENMRRGRKVNVFNSSPTHCAHNHPFDELNTRLRPNGKRECRTCERIRESKRIRFR